MAEQEFSLSYWVIVSTAVHIMAFVAVVLHALRRRRNASATILWIFVAWSFPLLGPLLYLSFGVDRIPSKGLERKAVNRLMMDQRDRRHKETGPFLVRHLDYRSTEEEPKSPLLAKLSKALDAQLPEHPLLHGTDIEPLVCGDEAYPRMLQAIHSARHHIHLQSFIIRSDETGRQFLEALRKKAAEGVQVRLMYDRFGSTHAYLTGFFRRYRRLPNFEVCGWTQANPFKRQFQINLRNHRKNLIVDGHVAFFGGVNMADENVTRSDTPAIRDYHFKVEGPLVHELQLSFLKDWHFMTGESIDHLLTPEHFPAVLSVGPALSRIVNSGPSEPAGLLGDAFFNAIILAERQILLVTPYFVPTGDLLMALTSAAHRGVDVRIVLPEKNNHRYAGWASRALYEDLLTAGVRIFQRKPPFIHAKAMLVDDSVALVGTANLDVRSLELNYETVVLFEEERAIGSLKRMIHEDIKQSRELILNEWVQRPATHKVIENLCVLMTPVL